MGKLRLPMLFVPARCQTHGQARLAHGTGVSRRGFTITETIVAVLILAIAMPPMLWSLRQGQAAQVNPILSSRARWLATEKLEDIIADRHSSVRGYAYLWNPSQYPAEATIPDFPGFSRQVSLTETEADLVTAGTGYTVVTVTVSWTDATGIDRDLVISTVLTDYSS